MICKIQRNYDLKVMNFLYFLLQLVGLLHTVELQDNGWHCESGGVGCRR